MPLTLDVLREQLGFDIDPNILEKVVSGIDNLITAGTIDVARGGGKILETAGDLVEGAVPEVRVAGMEVPSPLSAARNVAGKVSDVGKNTQAAADASESHNFPKVDPKASFVDAVDASVDASNKGAVEGAAPEPAAEPEAPAAEPTAEPAAKPDPAKDPKVNAEKSDGDPESDAQIKGSQIKGSLSDDAAAAEAPDPNHAADLFRTAHGGEFDPASSMDKRKMSEIENMLKDPENQKLTPNQFALKLYREHGYV